MKRTYSHADGTDEEHRATTGLVREPETRDRSTDCAREEGVSVSESLGRRSSERRSTYR